MLAGFSHRPAIELAEKLLAIAPQETGRAPLAKVFYADNGADGLWRWMPSINVDMQGNLAIDYSASSTTVEKDRPITAAIASEKLANAAAASAKNSWKDCSIA